MKYSIETISKDIETNKFIFFWGHQPSKDGSITKTCFSQWWASSFEVEGIQYNTAEHWMMVRKALLFNDREISERILATSSPAEAKKMGREIVNYDEAIWTAQRYDIVVQGNYHKFRQNEQLLDFLINSKERILVEASPVDKIWGVGMASDHPDITNPHSWKGFNLLGFALMEVRDILKQEV